MVLVMIMMIKAEGKEAGDGLGTPGQSTGFLSQAPVQF